jgi:hypothetical protein
MAPPEPIERKVLSMSEREEIDWFLGDLNEIKAFSRGPSPREPSDAELLGKALDPHADIFSHLIIRGKIGSPAAFKPGAQPHDVRDIIGRVQRLLKHYEPTTRKDKEALRIALSRFGVDRMLPERKRERTP